MNRAGQDIPVPRRVAVSGMGALSALGLSVAATRRSLYRAASEPALPTRFATTLKAPVFELSAITARPGRPGGVTNEMLSLALDEALSDAGLSRSALRGKRVGVAVGTTVGCQLNNIDFYAALRAGQAVDAAVFTS